MYVRISVVVVKKLLYRVYLWHRREFMVIYLQLREVVLSFRFFFFTIFILVGFFYIRDLPTIKW